VLKIKKKTIKILSKYMLIKNNAKACVVACSSTDLFQNKWVLMFLSSLFILKLMTVVVFGSWSLVKNGPSCFKS
jgi:hypothetical protein